MSRLALNPRRIIFIESLLLSLILVVFAWLAGRVYGGPYLPSSAISDGFGYFVEAKSFFLNHQLGAAVIHLDRVSPIGEFYSHGFAYSLINGGFALLVGWHDKLIIAINVVLLAIAATFILTRSYEWAWKLVLLLLFMTFYLTPTMTFAYMQEIVHLLLALMLGQLLMTIIDHEDTERNWRLLLCYYILIAVFALMRPTWVFWAVGPLALANSKRDFVLLGFLSVFSLALGYLSLKLFFAPYPYYTPYAASAAAFADHQFLAAARALLEFLRHNSAKLFSNHFYIFGETYIPNIYNFLILGITTYLLNCFRRDRDRRALAVALIAATYFSAIITTYDILAGARVIAPVFVLQLIYLVRSKRSSLIATLAVAQLAMFAGVVGITNRIIDFQANAGEYALENRAQLEKVNGIASAIRTGRRATIYIDDALTNGEYPLTIHLPLRSEDGNVLRYSQDIFAPRPMLERKFNMNFLDFVLAANPLSRPDLTPIYDAAQFHLYKVKK